MTTFIILVLTFSSVAVFAAFFIPWMSRRAAVMAETKQKKMATHMERIMSRQEAKKRSRVFVLAPIGLAIVGAIVFPEEIRLAGAFIGLVFGFVFPGIYIQFQVKKSHDKFTDQLVDALMIMSSSFRGGLSLVQALEAVVEEMPDPINQEFGTVLGENKMGVSLEEALYHLYQRQPSSAMQQMITAILLARETGGNLPVIFTRIVNNIREHKKIQQNLDTLTLQGKIQGVVMIFLPIGFTMIVYSSNKRVFDHMLHSDVGRTLLVVAIVLEVIGSFMIWKISTFKEF